jgi:hypothetical protein
LTWASVPSWAYVAVLGIIMSLVGLTYRTMAEDIRETRDQVEDVDARQREIERAVSVLTAIQERLETQRAAEKAARQADFETWRRQQQEGQR